MARNITTGFSMLGAVSVLAACFLGNERSAGSRVGTETTLHASVRFPDASPALYARVTARNWDYRPDSVLRDSDNFEISKTTDENNAFSMTLTAKDSLFLEISSNDNAYGAWLKVGRDGKVPDTIALAPGKTLQIMPIFSNSISRLVLGFLGTNRYFSATSQAVSEFRSVPTARFPVELMVQSGASAPLVSGKIQLDSGSFNGSDTLALRLNLDPVIQKVLDSPGGCVFKLDSAGSFVLDQAQGPQCFPAD